MGLKILERSHNTALRFKRKEVKLQGYVDLNLSRDKNKRRSTTAYVFTLGDKSVSYVS